MKYKKVILFLMLVLGVAVVCRSGFRPEEPETVAAARKEVQAVSDKREVRESDKIAVVNLDEGAKEGGRQINYAQELSRFPTMDFEYASLEAARTGVETGRYGAYVIIPAVFSQNVQSINTTPQVSRLEYAVNKSYSGERQYELLYNVRSYIESLNNHLSYMYVDSILKEFHDAQDGADRVMENDLRDKEAIEKIRTQELVALAEVPDYQAQEDIPEELDITDYMKENGIFTAALNGEYIRSVQHIQSEIASLSADGMALSEHLESLYSKVSEIDLSVDENGKNIIEKADGRLRVELERQTDCILDKEKIACYLRQILESHMDIQEYLKQIGKQPEEPPKPPEQTEEGTEPPFGDTEDVKERWEEGEEDSREPEKASEQLKEPPEQTEGPSEQTEEPPEQTEELPEQSDEWQKQSSEQMITWLEEKDQELSNFIEEVQRAKELDIDRIRELVKSEYADPIISRADEAKKEYKQRQEKEIAAIAAYNGRLESFEPHMDDQFILENIDGMAENYALLQDNLLGNSRAYEEYAKKSADSVREYADELQKQAEDDRIKSEAAIAEGLSEAKKTKKETSFANQKILADFMSKLPYTRMGRAEYTRVYQFVANPMEAEDHSEEHSQNRSRIETDNVTKRQNQTQIRAADQDLSGNPDKKEIQRPIVFVVSGGIIIVLAAQVFFFIRRKKEYEY